MASRILNGLRTTGGDKLLTKHLWKKLNAPPRATCDSVATETPAGAMENPAPSVDRPCTLNTAAALGSIEEQENRFVTNFLFAYAALLSLLAILFVYVCAPP